LPRSCPGGALGPGSHPGPPPRAPPTSNRSPQMPPAAVASRPSIPAVVPVLNPLIRRLLRIGVPMGPNALVTIRGRRSGEPRTFPAAVMRAGDRPILVATFGETNWLRTHRLAD